MVTKLHTETAKELRIWERLQGILTATDHNKELIGRMIRDHKYINAQFLQQLDDNANSVKNIVAEVKARL